MEDVEADMATLNVEDKSHEPSTEETDPPIVEAQAYPWMHMTSTLDACFKETESESTIEDSVHTESEVEEEEILEHRVPLETEPPVHFQDDERPTQFTKDAPKIMQAFLTHGNNCSAAESEALKVATKEFDGNDDDDHPMDMFNIMLDRLDYLLQETQFLQTAITTLISIDPYASFEGSSEATVARATIVPLFGSCLPALRGRTANLSLAQQLVEGAKEKFAMDIHLASLEFDDDDDDYVSADEDEDEDGAGDQVKTEA
ncbi:hypothetical protein BDZ89DRAFT_1036335 [Hymenopellis radicata]|nr:hypothetical protein BDZ89DRAFT_1036335 [Hymenopellis radicata]